MINQEKFLSVLSKAGIEFFTGVPDSYLNGFCNYLLDNVSPDKHVIAANEGNAIGIAAGYYFSTKSVPLVYMQNSGIGNTLNPLISLADKHVYKVPMVLVIGWRGEPGSGDWPQHHTQGIVTPKILDMLEIPYIIAEDNDMELEMQVHKLLNIAKKNLTPVAIIARKGVFAVTKKSNIIDNKYPMSREEAIETILDTMPSNTIYCATTGRATRELYFLRECRGEGHQCDFLNVGSMGHASSVALGIALAKKNRKVVCLDGDSAALMHLGAFTMASKELCTNLMHVVLNNGAHESVGGQPSAGQLVDFTCIARGSGYQTVNGEISTKKELVKAIEELNHYNKSSFIDVRIHKGLKRELPPLNISHEDLIKDLINELKK